MDIFRFTSVLGLLVSYTSALQVTPNSPCASFCMDSEGDDVSDPNSSTTTNKDITCLNSKYESTPAGRKFQSCISCLQDSTFSQGSESDQLWFLYNLRYTFDNCLFGFPNAVGVPSSPCSTFTACGSLAAALTSDLNPNNPDYSYCDVQGGIIADSAATCRSCISPSEDQGFLVNYLVALEAGCNQRPAAGTVLGLNDTVFSATEISAVDPVSKDSEDSQSTLPTTTIVGIAVGGLVAVLAVAGLFFVCFRKRRNRRLRLEGDTSRAGRSRPGLHRRASSLSFRCQTHLTPRSPEFPNQIANYAVEGEKNYSNPHVALGSHPIAPTTSSSSSSSWTPPASWQRQSAIPSLSRPGSALRPLQGISTTPPTVPDNVHYSTSPRSSQFSPYEDVPGSTTSTKTTAQLLPLRSYNPAEYGVSSPHIGSPADGSYASPISGSTASPLLSRVWDRQNRDSMSPIWEMPQRETIVHMRPKAGGTLERISAPLSPGKKRSSNISSTGSPVESKEISMIFPGPPSPGNRWRRA